MYICSKNVECQPKPASWAQTNLKHNTFLTSQATVAVHWMPLFPHLIWDTVTNVKFTGTGVAVLTVSGSEWPSAVLWKQNGRLLSRQVLLPPFEALPQHLLLWSTHGASQVAARSGLSAAPWCTSCWEDLRKQGERIGLGQLDKRMPVCLTCALDSCLWITWL